MRIATILTILLSGCSSTMNIGRPGAGAGPCGFSHAGERWTIELADGSRVLARQVAIGVQDVVFRDDQGFDRSFPRAAVREVRNASTARGALKGMGGGALATGVSLGLIGLMSGDDDPHQWFAMTASAKGASGLVFGGALGGFVGLLGGIAGADTEHCIVAGPAADPSLLDSVVVSPGPHGTSLPPNLDAAVTRTIPTESRTEFVISFSGSLAGPSEELRSTLESAGFDDVSPCGILGCTGIRETPRTSAGPGVTAYIRARVRPRTLAGVVFSSTGTVSGTGYSAPITAGNSYVPASWIDSGIGCISFGAGAWRTTSILSIGAAVLRSKCHLDLGPTAGRSNYTRMGVLLDASVGTSKKKPLFGRLGIQYAVLGSVGPLNLGMADRVVTLGSISLNTLSVVGGAGIRF